MALCALAFAMIITTADKRFANDTRRRWRRFRPQQLNRTAAGASSAQQHSRSAAGANEAQEYLGLAARLVNFRKLLLAENRKNAAPLLLVCGQHSPPEVPHHSSHPDSSQTEASIHDFTSLGWATCRHS